MSNLDLSISILSYNTKKTTLECLESLIKHTKDVSYEIIVVDNGSTDGSVEALKEYSKRHNHITFIDVGENLGFGRGNNLAAKKAKGKYLLFLNSDTIFIDNSLKKAVDEVKKISNLGVYSCKLLNTDKTTQASGGYFPDLCNVLAWQLFIDDLPLLGSVIPSFHPKTNIYGKSVKVDWVTGAFMIVPMEVFHLSGGFDENIFMYTEEMELTYRISKLGYQTVYSPHPSIIHLGGVSSGSFLAITSEVKNMIYFWKKHRPLWQLPIIKTAFFTGSLLRLVIFGIIKGDEKARQTYSRCLRLSL